VPRAQRLVSGVTAARQQLADEETNGTHN
jgi:hypothetical protein